MTDNRVPLELGGTNDPSNLYAQLRPKAKRKDWDEGKLRRAVCSAAMTLRAAQAMRRAWSR